MRKLRIPDTQKIRRGVNTVVNDSSFKQNFQDKLEHLSRAERSLMEPVPGKGHTRFP